jgi:hypothetical protein
VVTALGPMHTLGLHISEEAGVTVPAAELTSLVDEWLTLPDVAARLGVEVTRVRQAIREGRLVALRPDPDGPLLVPAAFVGDGVILKGLPGLITVLRDQDYDDDEIVRWLYTPDDSLPGTPVQALVENRGTEVKRRAQALGF